MILLMAVLDDRTILQPIRIAIHQQPWMTLSVQGLTEYVRFGLQDLSP